MMFTTSRELAALEHVRHGFFTRHGGVSEGEYGSLNTAWSNGDSRENIVENRRRVASAIGAEAESLLTCHQIHSPDAVTVTEIWNPAENPKADAMVTNRPGIALGVLSADCVPLLLADPAAGIIGAAHAGWRGALSGVIENTIAAMSALGAKPENIVAAIGPCIWQNSYEVGPEFPAPFLVQHSDYARYFRPSTRAGHYMFDLPGLTEEKLRLLGIRQITPSPADTLSSPDLYFSYRRNTLQNKAKNGSLIAAIMLT
ncbi:MAG: peptidoglycan editing factor PgeF [Alphaproteobacteria bacterium]